MSTYRKKDRPFYFYDFELRGRRFHGSTRCTSKREADAFEKRRRAEADEELKAQERLGREPMTFKVAGSRYWDEVGQHGASVDDTLWSLEWLERQIGGEKRLTEINDSLLARLVAKRRGDQGRGGERVKNATVNRTVTEPLRRVVRRASKVWHEPVGRVDWRRHLLKEPAERVRELRVEEEGALFAALRSDYHAVVRFALITGCRLSECVNLRWGAVDWGARKIWINGKGGKLAPIPLPPTVRELLWPLQGHHQEFVFTYVAERAMKGRRHGQRYPISYEGLKTAFRRDVKRVIPGYRFHDNRHTAATRLLRSSSNIRLVKEMLRHADIATTMKYAHVTHDDIPEAMERAAQTGSVTETPAQSPARTKTGTGETE
jgi:integrase